MLIQMLPFSHTSPTALGSPPSDAYYLLKDYSHSPLCSSRCPPSPCTSNDSLTWSLFKDGSFSISSLYHYIALTSPLYIAASNIWTAKAPFKVIIVACIAFHGRLLTADVLAYRNIVTIFNCVFRHSTMESVHHQLMFLLTPSSPLPFHRTHVESFSPSIVSTTCPPSLCFLS